MAHRSGKPKRGIKTRDAGITAFSLVEVVLAMGIVSFALIILFALLPIGLKSNSDSMGESQGVNLLQAMIADRQSSAYSNSSTLYSLPALTNVTTQLTGTLYVMEDGVTTNAQPSAARYRVNYTVYPPTNTYAGATNTPVTGPPLPVSINFRVSWPAAQTNRPSSVETIATFMR
jgi:uncharacterized protein (TIGR02598 family)